MDLEFWANIATIISLPISIIALIIGGQAIYKVNKIIDNSQKNEINRTKIKNSKINQNNTRRNMKIIKFNKKYYKQVNNIYKKSFPKEERYISLNKMIKNKDAELYCLVNKEEVYGIIYLIKHKEMIFILYLAINPEIRSKGYGSYLLKWCLNKYNEKDIYLNIDEVNENKKDYETRKRRQKFYLKNGFYMTDYISEEDMQNYNILCNNKIVKIEDYMELDKFVAQILNEPVSNIVKNNIKEIQKNHKKEYD